MVPTASNVTVPSPKSHLLESSITGRLLVSVKRTLRGTFPVVTFAVKSILDAPCTWADMPARIRARTRMPRRHDLVSSVSVPDSGHTTHSPREFIHAMCLHTGRYIFSLHKETGAGNENAPSGAQVQCIA